MARQIPLGRQEMNRKAGPMRGDGGAVSGGARGGGAVWLHGLHAVLAALDNPERRRLRRVMTVDNQDERLAARLAADGPLERLDKQALERLLPPGAVHQGVALQVAPLPERGLDEAGPLAQGKDRAVILVLDQVTDPHNVGAILRSAAAFGVLAVVVQDRHAPGETGALAKAASGALEIMPVLRASNIARALEDLKREGFWCVGLDGAAPVAIARAGLAGRIALVLGAEGRGLRRLVRERCDMLVSIPLASSPQGTSQDTSQGTPARDTGSRAETTPRPNPVTSLNVSNAAAVALYELHRENNQGGE